MQEALRQEANLACTLGVHSRRARQLARTRCHNNTGAVAAVARRHASCICLMLVKC